MYRKTVICLLIVALYALSLVANAANIEKGLFLYLPIDEGAGDKVKDYGPNNFKTEMSNMPRLKKPKWVRGNQPKFDKALEFDGEESYVKIDAADQGKDFDAHFDKKKGMTFCAWGKVIQNQAEVSCVPIGVTNAAPIAEKKVSRFTLTVRRILLLRQVVRTHPVRTVIAHPVRTVIAQFLLPIVKMVSG